MLLVRSRVPTAGRAGPSSAFFAPRGRSDFCGALCFPAAAGSRISPDRILVLGKLGTPPCRSGQLKKDLGLEVSSVRDAVRLMFEIMRSSLSLVQEVPAPRPQKGPHEVRPRASAGAWKSRKAVSQRRSSLTDRPRPAKDAMKRRMT